MEQDPDEVEVFRTDIEAEAVDGRPRLVETPVGRLALLRHDGRVIAIEAWCPHLDGPLWEGTAAADEIACPWHGWRFSLKTGLCTWAPKGDAEEAAETQIRLLETHVVDGCVALEVPTAPPGKGS